MFFNVENVFIKALKTHLMAFGAAADGEMVLPTTAAIAEFSSSQILVSARQETVMSVYFHDTRIRRNALTWNSTENLLSFNAEMMPVEKFKNYR